ncbi:unnamed protein product [Dicrocoelium dendriticum]|nr:unnamed protein product [Dicrocoelium dendriticum]
MASCERGYQMTLSWVPYRGGPLPDRAIEAGDGVYVCRAKHEGEMIPGKFVSCYNTAYTAYGGIEHKKQHFEFLCDSAVGDIQSHQWKPDSDGKTHHHTVVGGITVNGRPSYIARTSIDGEIVVGRVLEEHGCASFPYGGREVRKRHYEVLIWEK